MQKAARAVAVALSVLVPAVAWPGVGDTFTTVRVAILATGTGAIVALLLLARAPLPEGGHRLTAATAWLAVLGVSAAFAPLVSLPKLLQELLVVAWAFGLAWAAPSAARVAAALRLAAAIVAAWAVLQWLGVDPWAAVGWAPAGAFGPRMRVYSTLGNPNHVGAFLAAVLPLVALPVLVSPRRWTNPANAILVGAAIVATGSRGALLGAAAGLSWLLLSGVVPRRAGAVTLLIGLAAIGTGVILGPSRTLGETWRGRVYIWSVAAPHLLNHPVTGWGPGSFAATYPLWEAGIERGVDRDVRTYAAAQVHAHNDYVERLSELGVPGVVVWCAILAWVLAAARARKDGSEGAIAAAAAAGVAALAAVSLVDFPMQRLVQRFTWWTLAVLATNPVASVVPQKRA